MLAVKSPWEKGDPPHPRAPARGRHQPPCASSHGQELEEQMEIKAFCSKIWMAGHCEGRGQLPHHNPTGIRQEEAENGSSGARCCWHFCSLVSQRPGESPLLLKLKGFSPLESEKASLSAKHQPEEKQGGGFEAAEVKLQLQAPSKDLQALPRGSPAPLQPPAAIALASDVGNARFSGAEGSPSTRLLPAVC